MKRLAFLLLFLAALATCGFLLIRPNAQANPDATITVTSTADSGLGTLRQALLDAQGGDTIVFDTTVFPPGSPATITLSSTLPSLGTGNVTVDGSSAGVIVDGVTKAFNCFVISGEGSDDNTIKGLQIKGCLAGVRIESGADNTTIGGTTASERNVISGNSTGVLIRDSGTTGNVVKGNYVGTNAIGNAANPNAYGVQITGGAQGNTVGGTTTGERNVISGNSSYGVQVAGTGSTGNTVEGNYIGINPWGTSPPLANGTAGVRIDSGAQGNVVGGTTTPGSCNTACNVISGNWKGIDLADPGTNGNTVEGNYVGIGPGGDRGIPNEHGVYIESGAQGNAIGGSTPDERNVISGNSNQGVYMEGTNTSGNVVKGNYIGTNPAGTAALPNGGHGVLVSVFADNNIIGGSTAGERNVISGNTHYAGVHLEGVHGTTVKGNYIGTNAQGVAPIPNAEGINIDSNAQGNTIGGSTPDERNVISGNGGYGILFYTARGNAVKGNYIGTDATGTTALGNGIGVEMLYGANGNAIGGGTASDRNVISGNTQYGVLISLSSKNNTVKGNYIGTAADGTAAVPNATGVQVSSSTGYDSQNNIIGGTATGDGNVIAYNTGDGVQVDGETSTGNTVSRNSIHSNGGKGIENINGGNMELAPPVIDSVGSASGHTNPKCYPCTVEVFSDNGDEGRIYHGPAATNDDGTGTWTYPGAVTGPNITATTTHADGNTSEFSAAMPLSNTPEGDNIVVPLNGGLDAIGGLEVTFPTVSTAGNTTVTTSIGGPPPPTGYKIVGTGGQPTYYDINTTATYSTPVTVCIKYDATEVVRESNLKLKHKADGGWEDITKPPPPPNPDLANHIICGETDTLSFFAIMEPLAAPVGGIAELPDAPDSPGLNYIALAAVAAAGLAALTAGGWYARRRWLG